ncbi:MAG: phosphate ABC transporter substrate-binding protein, PhoT family [Bacteroidetes bacterium]|nr:MAG: phosphate ABC transporter substrate-binding protein, PhoT family [Bacteroidota bacterium]
MKLIRYFRFFAVLWLIIIFPGCSSKKIKAIPGGDDTPTSGIIHISVDETYKPIIDSQIKVFMSQFPNATVIPHYKSEAECLKDLTNDSIRMVIVTRGLSEEEVKYLKDTLGFAPMWDKIASDAIAVIVNKEQSDTLFDISEIKGIVAGTTGSKLRPVLDGKAATSTVRFMLDSVLRGQPLSPEVSAADSSQGVIDYVSKNKDAIGFIGVNWIGNPQDPEVLHFLTKVTVASIQSRNDPDKYIKPYQANIATKRYPLVRGLYYIVKENYSGLGRGFANFMQFEKGQKIFWRAYLVPTKMDFQIRDASIKEE